MTEETARVEVDLTEEELDCLWHAALEYRDIGPPGEGWKTDEAQSMSDKVMVAVDVARAARFQPSADQLQFIDPNDGCGQIYSLPSSPEMFRGAGLALARRVVPDGSRITVGVKGAAALWRFPVIEDKSQLEAQGWHLEEVET